ncbi:MAG: 4-alpha-glucanotransferase [Desulfobulbaceae bacterium]|nr:4-alpha-glucanotransferase [Desulfobulbaceae bacterium]
MDNDRVVNILQQRSSGILLPVFSLPGPFGIGDLGEPARLFIDFLKKSGQRYWQILPLGPTSRIFGDSPYMSYSTFAGSPLLISLDLLIEQGLLQIEELAPPLFSEYSVEYQKVDTYKKGILKLAWKRFQAGSSSSGTLKAFTLAQPWVVDYGLFLALKGKYSQKPWYQWPLPLRQRQPEALSLATAELSDQIDYYIFEQYLFFSQWQQLRCYANGLGIQLIGDLPIYVALDSVDVWANQQIFQLDAKRCEPALVAGVPPDYFSADGQRWGNPLYCWNTDHPKVKGQLWDWWEQRLRLNFTLVDTLRIDHFRGFESYWAIPAAEKTAVNGQWQKGPGLPFFKEMDRRLDGMSIIAEDLGHLTPEVEALRMELGYPGMKILLFAFDGMVDNSYLPYNLGKNCVVYTGTHDNDTAVGWYLSPAVDSASKQQAKRFANRQDDDAGSFHQDLIYLALSSVANLAILPMQDVLGFGNDCRINVPGTTLNNWQWRCALRFINNDLAAWLREISLLFGRVPLICPDSNAAAFLPEQSAAAAPPRPLL